MFKHLEAEMAAYDAMRDSLFEHHAGKFVVIVGDKLHGAYDTFDTAAREAVRAYGRGPYLIREVKEKTVMPLPSSVRFRFLPRLPLPEFRQLRGARQACMLTGF